MNSVYLCIDLKTFYASVECKERNRDPLTTNLVVADQTRTEKTIFCGTTLFAGNPTALHGANTPSAR